ncbi:CFA/I fimbrial subunit E [Pandoraea anapnoica]|uniref:CFA/I fimbrial subunit E n=1 Tax=Pandoraea anapnoica TaxID=2508301 RepID=A0A5E4ZUN5_9BURK|nr:CfaE/CblD family pilus tip adhesin [Pandoraea anapnoica]VVE64497.1 CFA/I fimbrial subunit E [Pandoraea anapnoica]
MKGQQGYLTGRGKRLAIWAAVVAGMAPALAQSQAFEPRDHHESVSLTFDLSAVPADWRFRSQLAAHYTPGDIRGSRTAFVCRSAVDTALGACATTPANLAEGPPSPVFLRFTEQRSKLQVDVGLLAARAVTVNGSTCRHRLTAFNSNRNFVSCAGRPYDVSRYLLTIPRTELEKIPVGGIWRGRFEFDVRTVGSSGPSAVHSYDIELNVTDIQNAQIYFPTLSNTAPRVAMDLRKRPGPNFQPIVYGGRSVDMCFYDGFGSNSAGALRVRATDLQDSQPGRPPGAGLMVLRGTPGHLPHQRIEYRVGLTHAGTHRWLSVGDAGGGVFSPVAQSPIRIVRLPGIPTPVACSPATLTFEVTPFVEREKDAGGYEGRLRIETFVDAAKV